MKRRYIVFLLPVAAVLITLFIRFGIPAVRQQLQTGKIREGQTTESQLPENWQVSSESESEVVLVRDEEDKEIQTKVVLLETEAEVEEFSSYVDRLVRGAQQTLPSLEYSDQSEVETVDDWMKKELAGFYFSGGNRINLIQEIYYQDGRVITITASYSDLEEDEIVQELDEAFDFLKETYL